ncbi:MAG TPA: alpha/beta fold hydrolase [Coriobacteriia bacterium]|nr:alpha/beta fold hydrolase [Coriobacteriia bacterium]
MEVPRSRRSRILRALGWTVLGLVMVLYIGFPVAMAVVAVWPTRADVGMTPEGFREVVITTSDAVELAAWYSEPTNGAAVIVLHGAGGSRESMRRQAAMLAKHGYGVLSLDLRGHGDSEGAVNRLGWEGTQDVAAAVEFLEQQDDVGVLGAFGSSMGGEVLLGSTGEFPQIRAAITDGATRRSTEELLALPSERPLVRNFTARVMYSAVRLLTWTEPPEPLLDEMLRTEATSFMLIAAGDAELEVAFNEHFADALDERATLWVVPGVTHTGAFSQHPEEYEHRVVTFLNEHLLRAEPARPAD